ncbi:MAG: RNA 2',3'-cyclic phosphodiesterase [Chloroflexi bacterium]|nr:RNA 2',3'-cyclic phosphodiesterase [Chloroflexota bacterium]
MSERMIRTFVAVELPGEVKASLRKLEDRLKRRMSSALGPDAAERALKWVDPEGVHLTLKFLGAVPASHLAQIENALRRAIGEANPLAIELHGLGAFPTFQRPRVLWIGVHGEADKLGQIHAQIDAEMAGLGFPREERAFSPHITLARLRETAPPDERRKIGEAVKDGGELAPMAVSVDTISLMRSELSRAGAHYTALARFSLV